MAAEERWYFTKEQLNNTPSRKCGIDADKELSNRQQCANFMQDLGQRIHVNQLCINTAIVYMHRFYMYHSFTKFPRHQSISVCALFLAAKVEEQPRKLEFIIKWAFAVLRREPPSNLDVNSEAYLEQAQELVINENIMLQTLGFDVAIDHPHTHVVKCCQLVRASKDLAQTSYFMATNSLHLTTMSVQYKPTVVACVCIHLACKWASWEIPKSSEGKSWFWYVDRTVTDELLEELTTEFVVILEKCPSRLKRKMLSCGGSNDKGIADANRAMLEGFASEPDDLFRAVLQTLPDEIMNLDKRFSGSGNSPTFPSTSTSEQSQDRERASSVSSSSSGRAPTKGGHLFDNGPTPVAPDKNGSLAIAAPHDAKARAAGKKERESNAHSGARASTSGSYGAATVASSSSASRASTSLSYGAVEVPTSANPTGPSQRLHGAAEAPSNPTGSTQRLYGAFEAPSCANPYGPSMPSPRRSLASATATSSTSTAAGANADSSHNSLATLTASPVSSRKSKPDGGNRMMTPKEYHERKKREQLERESERVPPITVPANAAAATQAATQKQPPHSRSEQREREAKGLSIASNNSSGAPGRPSQQPPQSGAGGARPSHHHHHSHPPHHSRKTPDKQRHHQQQVEAEQRHRNAAAASNSGGHHQRGPAHPHATSEERTAPLVTGAAVREMDGNHVGRLPSRHAAPPVTPISRPPPLLTPSPPPPEDDQDLPSLFIGGDHYVSDTLVNPLDGRAMVIPSMDSRGATSLLSSRNNHSVPASSTDRVADSRPQEDPLPEEEQQPPAKRHVPSVKDRKERLVKHHRSKTSDPSSVSSLLQPANPAPVTNPVPGAVPSVLPLAKQQNLGHHVLPNPHSERAEPAWSAARQAATKMQSASQHQHPVTPIGHVGSKRPGAALPSAHQPAKVEPNITEAHRVASAPSHKAVKMEPLASPVEKVNQGHHTSRSKTAKVENTTDVRRSAAPQQQHNVKAESTESKIAAGVTPTGSMLDNVFMTGAVESKLLAGHRHPSLLKPMSPTLGELKPAQDLTQQQLVHHVTKMEVATPKLEHVEALGGMSVKEILASAPPAAPLVSIVRESRVKTIAPSKETSDLVTPVAVEAVQVTPTIREVAKGKPEGHQHENIVVDGAKSRTSSRREGKESKAKPANPPPVAAELPVKGGAPLQNSVKISPPPSSSAASVKPELPIPAAVQSLLASQTPPLPPSAQTAAPSSKHERREKHRHKDKDRSSKERKREEAANRAAAALQQSATSTPPPSIKLTIARDRLQKTNNVDGNGSKVRSCSPKDGGLKIKIAKDKLSSSSNSKSSTSKSQNSMSSALVVTNSDGNGGGGVPSLGLKIKITKDRLGSKVMSVESKDKLSTPDAHQPHRKREREPSPMMAVTNDTEQPPAKAPKLTRATARRNSETGSHGATPEAAAGRPGMPTADVPPSSNTRSSRQEQQLQQQHNAGGGPRHSGDRGRGRGGYRGGPKGGPPNKQQHHMGHPGAPNMPYGHQSGPPYYPQQQQQPPFYSQYPPPPHHPHPSVANYFNHPPPHQYYNQPPPYGPPGSYGGPMPPHPGHRYPMIPPPQGPPLPREPPPAIPPPPPE